MKKKKLTKTDYEQMNKILPTYRHYIHQDRIVPVSIHWIIHISSSSISAFYLFRYQFGHYNESLLFCRAIKRHRVIIPMPFMSSYALPFSLSLVHFILQLCSSSLSFPPVPLILSPPLPPSLKQGSPRIRMQH